MKRRDFLWYTGASALVPTLARGLPCPPPKVSTGAGASATTACTAVTAQSDWITRSTGPGVMWAHNFASATEVDKFRFENGYGVDPTGGHDPNKTLVWDPTDGFAGGGNATITIPTGGTAAAEWLRPLQALPGDRGYTKGPDWVGQSTYTSGNWGLGFYGNSAYHDTSTSNGAPVWAGTDFYLQYRVKISASRFTAGNPDGKLIFIGVTNLTPDHEIVVQSLQRSEFAVYTNFGDRNNSVLSAPQLAYTIAENHGNVPGWSSYQPGGAYATTCVPPANNPNALNDFVVPPCWGWPADTWVTLLVHVIPGIDGSNPTGGDAVANNPNGTLTNVNGKGQACNNTGFQAWIALPGQTTYTKIWDKQDYVWCFQPGPNGWNSTAPSGYMNNVNAVAGWTQKFTQVIFSTQFIPCPQA